MLESTSCPAHTCGPKPSYPSNPESFAPVAPQVPALKYQLPGSPDVLVDVVDDEDVALMMDEWREAVAAGAQGLRLHVFVQVRSARHAEWDC